MFIVNTTMALRSFCPKNQTTNDAHVTGGATWPSDHEIYCRNATFLTDLSSQPVNLENAHAMTSCKAHQQFLRAGVSPE
jgi:hypothetical protein